VVVEVKDLSNSSNSRKRHWEGEITIMHLDKLGQEETTTITTPMGITIELD
jgi:hypothetical protein